MIGTGVLKMNTKKLIALVISGLLFGCTTPYLVFSGRGLDNDDFLVTMSGSYLEINIENASWNIGTVDMSTSYWTNETGETQNASTWNSTAGTNLDFEMVISVDAATWYTVWVGNYTTGANQYKMNASSDVWVSQEELNVTTYVDVASNFDPAVNVTFDLRFDSPTSTTTGAQQTVTLNGKVTIH